jgi:hypothetical protein
MPPFFIFPRDRVQEYMTQGAPPGSVAATNESGWTTAPNIEKYILHFLKYVRCSPN